MRLCVCFCFVCMLPGQTVGGQRIRLTEAGCFLQRAGGPAGREGKKIFVSFTDFKNACIRTKITWFFNTTQHFKVLNAKILWNSRKPFTKHSVFMHCNVMLDPQWCYLHHFTLVIYFHGVIINLSLIFSQNWRHFIDFYGLWIFLKSLPSLCSHYTLF